MKPILTSVVLGVTALTLATSCASKQDRKKDEPRDAMTQAEDRAVRANDALAEEAERHSDDAEAIGKRAEGFWGQLEKSWDKRF